MPVTDNLTPLPIKTLTNGAVSVKIDQTTPGTTNLVQVGGSLPAGSASIGKVQIDQATPGTTNGVQVNAALPTGGNTIGNVGLVAGAAKIGTVTTDQTTHGTTDLVAADVTKIGGAALGAAVAAGSSPTGNVLSVQGVASGVSMPTLLVAGSAKFGQAAIDQTTPGTTNGVQVNAALPTGANTIGNVGLVAGSAKFGQAAIDQTTPGTTNGVQVTGPGTSSGNPLFVSSAAGSSGTMKSSGALNSGSNIAAAGSATITAALITTAKVGSLIHFIGSSSAPMRWDVQSVNASGVATTVFQGMSNVASNMEWKPFVSGEIVTVAGDNTNVKYQVVANNEDNTTASGAYCTFWWTEA